MTGPPASEEAPWRKRVNNPTFHGTPSPTSSSRLALDLFPVNNVVIESTSRFYTDNHAIAGFCI